MAHVSEAAERVPCRPLPVVAALFAPLYAVPILSRARKASKRFFGNVYSFRSAVSGSTRAARQAGIETAMSPVAASTQAVNTKISGSAGLT